MRAVKRITVSKREERKGEMRLARKRGCEVSLEVSRSELREGCTLYFFKYKRKGSISFDSRELRVQQRKVLANMHTHTAVQEYYLAT